MDDRLTAEHTTRGPASAGPLPCCSVQPGGDCFQVWVVEQPDELPVVYERLVPDSQVTVPELFFLMNLYSKAVLCWPQLPSAAMGPTT